MSFDLIGLILRRKRRKPLEVSTIIEQNLVDNVSMIAIIYTTDMLRSKT